MTRIFVHDMLTSRSKHKYGAIPTMVDGIKFASKKEAKRYGELKLLERAGEIHGLKLQPEFPLTVNTTSVGKYRADFSYCECASAAKCFQIQRVVEDVKGMKTPVYRLKKRLMQAIYGIEIRES